jgi:hypothetical protein
MAASSTYGDVTWILRTEIGVYHSDLLESSSFDMRQCVDW